ncbi:MAG TPA: hypothetical protein VMZ71_06160 [Gemmataceae bacterium]|nr:hypothetical protein [Gemmataceae bacterium]
MPVRRVLAFAVIGLLAMTTTHGVAQKPKEPALLPKEADLMAAKLKHAQALLAALAKEDFKALEESATTISRISTAAAFMRAYKTEEYEFQARVFQKSADTLAEKAKAKNLDGATLAYLDITRSCVACHSHFRGKKRD